MAKIFTRWLQDHYLYILLILIPFLFAIAQFLISEEGLAIVSTVETRDDWKRYSLSAMGLLGCIYLIIIIVSCKHQQRLSVLSNQLADSQKSLESWEQDFETLITGYVFIIATKLEFGTRAQNTERITIYSHDEGKFFVPFGRFSPNTEYKKKGRDVYPDHQGCIAKAWQHGRYFCNDYPDHDADRSAYVNRVCREGYSRTEARNLAMKSRLFYGWRVLSSQDKSPLAVVLIESTEVERWTEDQLNSFFEKEDSFLREIVTRVSSRLPKPSMPGQSGF